jgi:hypothetical protein
MMIQNIEPCIITHKSILPGFISLLGIGDDVYIEIIFVPLFYLITGKELLPRLNALHCKRRKRISSEPTIMNNFRYHSITIPFTINLSFFAVIAIPLPAPSRTP